MKNDFDRDDKFGLDLNLNGQADGDDVVLVEDRMVELEQSDVEPVRLREHVPEVGMQRDGLHVEGFGVQRLLFLENKLIDH